MIAPKRLGIKVDAPVMLLRNIDDKYVNGLVWRVLDIEEGSIKVAFKFNDTTEVLNVKRCVFTKYDPKSNKCIAKRYQFPLKLAYAYTIHKSQGMTLPYCIVDCRHASNQGQIGVAIGRVQCVAGLRVVNFDPTLCRKHPDSVSNLYSSTEDIGDLSDISNCCKQTIDFKTEKTINDSDRVYSDSEDDLAMVIEKLDDVIDDDSNEVEESLQFIEIDHCYSGNTVLNCGSAENSICEHSYASSFDLCNRSMSSDFNTALEDYIGTPRESDARSTCG